VFQERKRPGLAGGVLEDRVDKAALEFEPDGTGRLAVRAICASMSRRFQASSKRWYSARTSVTVPPGNSVYSVYTGFRLSIGG
jgi:hypothetical protein